MWGEKARKDVKIEKCPKKNPDLRADFFPLDPYLQPFLLVRRSEPLLLYSSQSYDGGYISEWKEKKEESWLIFIRHFCLGDAHLISSSTIWCDLVDTTVISLFFRFLLGKWDPERLSTLLRVTAGPGWSDSWSILLSLSLWAQGIFLVRQAYRSAWGLCLECFHIPAISSGCFLGFC